MYLMALSPANRGKTILVDSHFQIISDIYNNQPAVLIRRSGNSLELINLYSDSSVYVKRKKKIFWFRKGFNCSWKQLPPYSFLELGSILAIGKEFYVLRQRPKKIEITAPKKSRFQIKYSIMSLAPLILLTLGFSHNLGSIFMVLPLVTLAITPITATWYWFKKPRPPHADEIFLGILAKSHFFQQKKTHPPTAYSENNNLPALSSCTEKPVAINSEGINLWLDKNINKIKFGDFICFYGSQAKNTAAWCVAQIFYYYPHIFTLNHQETNKIPVYFDTIKNLKNNSHSAIYFSWVDTETDIPIFCTHAYPSFKNTPSWQWWQSIAHLLTASKNNEENPEDNRLISHIAHLFTQYNDTDPPTISDSQKQLPNSKLAKCIYQEWCYQTKQKNSLAFILGQYQGQIYWLDLLKSGPHMLLAGTTGAGKSTALQAFILGLALRYSPQDLSLILVDYKGGEAFGKFASLPHCVGVLTNLKPAETERALSSLLAEIKYRESIQNPLKTLPRILLIVDEFRILATDHPEIMETIIRLCILGRSLGIHIILATQQPGGCVDHQIRSNTAIRLSLKMLSASDSQEVLGICGAESLPSPGHILGIVDDIPIRLKNLWIADTSQIKKLITATKNAWSHWPSKHLRLPWAEPLPKQISLPTDPLPPTKLYLGIGDFPEQQQLQPVYLESPLALQITASPNVGQSELISLLAFQLLQRQQFPIHLLSLKPQPFLDLLPRGQSWPGHLGTDPQSIAEILRISASLQGTVLIEDIQAITQLLERTYHRYHYAEDFTTLCNQAGNKDLSLVVSCLPNQGHSRIFQALDSRLVGFLRDPLQAVQLGLTQKTENLLDRPGKFILQSNTQVGQNKIVVQPYTHPKATAFPPSSDTNLAERITNTTGFIRPLPRDCTLANLAHLGVGLYGPVDFPPPPLVLIYDSLEKQQDYLNTIIQHYQKTYPDIRFLENSNFKSFPKSELEEPYCVILSQKDWQNSYQLEIEQCLKKNTVLILGNIDLPTHLIDFRNSEAGSPLFPSPPGRAILISQRITKTLQVLKLPVI